MGIDNIRRGGSAPISLPNAVRRRDRVIAVALDTLIDAARGDTAGTVSG